MRTDDRSPPRDPRRLGPYEAAYDVLRGYDVAPPVHVAGPAPVLAAGRRDDRAERR